MNATKSISLTRFAVQVPCPPRHAQKELPMAGIYDEDPTDLRTPRNAKTKGGGKLLRFGEGVLGTLGALAVTFVACYVLALAVLWIAGRMISIGGGSVSPLIVAAVLTGAFYWYDRSNR